MLEYLTEINMRLNQVYKYDKIRINPNRKWHKEVCTYKWCYLDKIIETKGNKEKQL